MIIIGDGIVLGAGGATASIFVTGLSETDTVTASKDGKTVVGKWTQKPNPAAHGLPDGYTELEYIEGTGTQWIDTGIACPSGNLTIEYQITQDTYSAGCPFCGNNSGTAPAFYHQRASTGYLYLGSWTGGTTYNNAECKSVTVLDKTIVKLELSSSAITLTVDGVTASTSYSAWRNSNNITFFKEPLQTSGFTPAILHYLKMWIDGTLLRDMVPAKRNSDGAIGLYDLVTSTFFGNAGTGTFTAGAEVPQTIDGFLIEKIKDYGTWTVTATDGTHTKTLDVFVDAANTFFVNINYIYRYDDMVLWLDGTDFLDHSKNGLEMNRGTYPSLSATDFDKSETNCYLFDNNSTSTSLYTLSNPVMNMGGFSFSWWMKVSSKPSYSCCWYMSKDASVSGSYAIGCNTTIGTTGKYGVCARTSSGATADVTSTYVTPTNTSLHCVQTYDGTTMKLYVNGQLVWSASNSLGFSSVSVGRINIGHNMWNTSVERFMGYMTDIRLYNAVLTSDEILEMFETGTEIHS